MLKTKFNYLLIILFLLNGFRYSQTKDYKRLYSDLIKGISSNQEFRTKTTEFFNSMDNIELPFALADISKDEDVNFVVYNLIVPNKSRFVDKVFMDNMVEQLSVEQNSSNFKIVAIDFISEYDEKENTHLEEFNLKLFEIARNENFQNNLRSYAASHMGKIENYEISKMQLNELLKSQNYATIDGTARAIVKLLPRDKSGYWTDILINTLDQNANNLNEISAVLTTLSLTKSDKAKQYLLNLFKDNVASDAQLSEKLVYSLSNIADTKVLNKIFTEYSKYDLYNNFGAELTLKQIVSKNNSIIEKLYSENDDESKLNYLRAVRVMKDENRIKHLNKVKQSLNADTESERLEAVKTLHFLLPYEDEKKVFKEHISRENSELVKNQIYYYVGE